MRIHFSFISLKALEKINEIIFLLLLNSVKPSEIVISFSFLTKYYTTTTTKVLRLSNSRAPRDKPLQKASLKWNVNCNVIYGYSKALGNVHDETKFLKNLAKPKIMLTKVCIM